MVFAWAGSLGQYDNLSRQSPDALVFLSDGLSHHICTAAVVRGLKFTSELFTVSLSVMNYCYKCICYLIFLPYLLRIKVAYEGCVYTVLRRYLPICAVHGIYAAGSSDLVCVQCFYIGGREIASSPIKDHSEVPRADPSQELMLQRIGQEIRMNNLRPETYGGAAPKM